MARVGRMHHKVATAAPSVTNRLAARRRRRPTTTTTTTARTLGVRRTMTDMTRVFETASCKLHNIRVFETASCKLHNIRVPEPRSLVNYAIAALPML